MVGGDTPNISNRVVDALLDGVEVTPKKKRIISKDGAISSFDIEELSEKYLLTQKDIVDERERNLRRYKKLAENYAESEKRLQETIDSLKREIEERDRRILESSFSRSKEIELLTREVEKERVGFLSRIADKEREVSEKNEEIERVKKLHEEEGRSKFYSGSSAFLNSTISNLERDYKENIEWSRWWAFASVGVIVGSILIVTFFVASKALGLPELSWQIVSLVLSKGAVIGVVSVYVSRYLFQLSDNHMQESIRISDKLHAIKYGQLYIESYGVSANWEEVKELLKDWNITVNRKLNDSSHVNQVCSKEIVEDVIEVIKDKFVK